MIRKIVHVVILQLKKHEARQKNDEKVQNGILKPKKLSNTEKILQKVTFFAFESWNVGKNTSFYSSKNNAKKGVLGMCEIMKKL